jgi:5S rRNA maturation endonuclease (ribonuclease M5)
MSSEKSGFIQVDELMPQVTVEDVARHYGIVLPELKRVGAETRSVCFLTCGKTRDTGDRALSIQCDDLSKKWHCHQYGCGKGGNLLSLMDLMKPGVNAGGRPRGDRFKELAADLQAITSGERPPEVARTPAAPLPESPKVNLPLAKSENERARALTELDRKFTLEVAAMPPRASTYFRRRGFLTPEVCRSFRMGYLRRGEKGEDKSGGTMRGKIVYPYLSDKGDVLTWFGRDPDYEDKHQSWNASDRSEPEPQKFHFIKGFHRGLELFGQDRIRTSEAQECFRKLGVLTVEGPNDVIRLATLGVTALGLCSNTITREQAEKLARIAREHGNGVVTVFLDCDTEGETGMKQCLGYLAQLCPVRLAWTSRMYGGKFKACQPENLNAEQWKDIEAYLLTGMANGWSLT